ncbi:MAG: hypothetical protein ACK5MG_04935 [Bacteroidales bacterium]
MKIDESIFREARKKSLKNKKKSRNRYINKAISSYNKLQRQQILGDKLKSESRIVCDESLSVLKEFEDTDYAD